MSIHGLNFFLFLKNWPDRFGANDRTVSRVFAQTNICPQKGKYLAFSILAGRKTGFRLTNIRLLEQKTETFSRLF